MHFLNTAYIYQSIYDFFSGGVFADHGILSWLGAFIRFILESSKPLSVLLAVLFLTGGIYSIIRTRLLVRELAHAAEGHDSHEHKAHAGSPRQSLSRSAGEPPETVAVIDAKNKRWEKILEHVNSENQSDWRLAILEGDIILEEMLQKMGYRGDTVGDKLKAVEKSDFLTIDKAWEAHRVRNAIAHESGNFQITNREARRVVSLYEEVFKEFHYI